MTTEEKLLKLYAALKRITRYQTPEQLQRSHERDWGLPYEEALVYAYENIQQEARDAIRGMRLPRQSAKEQGK
jgi:hypothetical protein